MRSGTLCGIVFGIVCDLDDPLGLGRVRVRYPDLDGAKSDWARLVTPMAGPKRGLLFRPELDDEVVVVFERGDPTSACVLGGVWSQPDPPPDGGSQKANDRRLIRSRSGHVVTFDDTSGSESVEIVDKDGSRKVVLDSAGRKVTVVCDDGDVEVTASGTVRVEAADVRIHAKTSLVIESDGPLEIKGTTVKIN